MQSSWLEKWGTKMIDEFYIADCKGHDNAVVRKSDNKRIYVSENAVEIVSVTRAFNREMAHLQEQLIECEQKLAELQAKHATLKKHLLDL